MHTIPPPPITSLPTCVDDDPIGLLSLDDDVVGEGFEAFVQGPRHADDVAWGAAWGETVRMEIKKKSLKEKRRKESRIVHRMR